LNAAAQQSIFGRLKSLRYFWFNKDTEWSAISAACHSQLASIVKCVMFGRFILQWKIIFTTSF
jgi:hypothetical protein